MIETTDTSIGEKLHGNVSLANEPVTTGQDTITYRPTSWH
jgi:hypothetical protein